MVPESVRITISLAVTFSTVPEFVAITQTPESLAALYSIPVAMMGASGLIRGTAWRCMLEPIRARFASSFSRNGIIAVATETSCLGETSIYWTLLGYTSIIWSWYRQPTRLLIKRPSSSRGSLAPAMIYGSSSSAVIYSVFSVTLPSTTFL